MDFGPLEIESDSDIDLSSDEEDNKDDYVDEGEETFNDYDNEILASDNKAQIAKMLLTKSKKCAAKYLKEEIVDHEMSMNDDTSNNLVLYEVLDILLDPRSELSNLKTITWLKWLIAGGETVRDFYRIVEQFDNPTSCSLVWIANFMAFRCRTCGISPCMSLCLECFNRGNHQGHDYNMFKSQAGGACDCGNRAVMHEEGFCSLHKGVPQSGVARDPILEPPSDLLLIAKYMMPKILIRFILHCRFNGVPSSSETMSESENESRAKNTLLTKFEPFVEFLQELCYRGAAMREVMTDAFCNAELYSNFFAVQPGVKFRNEIVKSLCLYYEAIDSLSVGDIPPGFEDISTLHCPLVHSTLLDELLLWTLKYEFPQPIVCLLLNMRPNPVYEDAFARAFVLHYSRISLVLLRAEDTDKVSHRVVHVSVQLFSDQKLALHMTNTFHLLYIMIVSIKKMIKQISVNSTLHDVSKNTHKVVNCSHDLMKHHCYWPLVSDLNNILSHEPIARKFMGDQRLLYEWYTFLLYFQGMNNNFREYKKYVEHEPNTYYASFSAELEVSACPLWAMMSHLKDGTTLKFSLDILGYCMNELRNWFKQIGFTRPDMFHNNEATFHLPLHRNYVLFMFHAVKKQGVPLADLLPDAEMLTLMLVHPLRCHVVYHEVMNNLWARNGLQMRGQAMTYVQCHFCNSLFDPDIFLLQLGAGELPKDSYLLSIIERFHVLKNLSFSKYPPDADYDESDRFKMLESCLVFLCVLMTNRHNLGLTDLEIAEREVVALTCPYDKTHSRLMDCMPERCISNRNIDLEAILKKFTIYKEPECQKYGTMKEGLYVPRDFVWEEFYDPIMVLTRCLNRREHQSAQSRFKQHCRLKGRKSARKARRLWPPYRLPSPVSPEFKDPRRVLACRTFHGILFTLLFKALHDPSYTENMLSLIIFLLELSIEFQIENNEGGKELASVDGNPTKTSDCPDGFFYVWFSSDNIFKNSVTRINRILINNYLKFQPAENENETNGEDFTMGELDDEIAEQQLGLESSTSISFRALSSGNELVPYQDCSSALVPSYMPLEDQIYSSQEANEDFDMIEIEDSDRLEIEFEPSVVNATRALPSGNEMVPYEESASALVSSSNPLEGGTCNAPVGNASLLQGNEMVLYEENVSSLVPTKVSSENEEFSEVVPSCSAGDFRPSYHARRSTALPAATGRDSCENKFLVSTGSSQTNELQSTRFMDTSHSEPAQTIEVAHTTNGQRRSRTREYLNVYESIISLLIKLHAKLSDRGGTYKPQFKPLARDSRIGGGTFFIAKVLNKLGQNDDKAKRHILECLGDDYNEGDSSSDEDDLSPEREAKRKRAKEWQKKVMASFNRKQQKFLAKNLQKFSSPEDAPERMEEEDQREDKEYDCVICNQSIPFHHSHVKPFGLIAYLQPTCIHGVRTTSSAGFNVPTSERARAHIYHRRYTLSRHMRNRCEIFNQYFDPDSWLNSLDLGWEAGLQVQTCGHYLHFDCQKAYMLSLQSQQHPNDADVVGAKYSKGEFHCPFCRHIANAVIPIFINETDSGEVSSSSSEQNVDYVMEIDDIFENMEKDNYTNVLCQALNNMLGSLKRTTPERYRTLPMNPEVSLPNKFVFLSSVLRTNLELELVKRGGSLVNQHQNTDYFKRSSLIPLMHVLAYHAKNYTLASVSNVSNRLGPDWIRSVWASLTQKSIFNSDVRESSTDRAREVPMLFRDPVTILIHILLLLPSSSIKTYFKPVIYYVYRFVVARATVSALRSMPEDRREMALVHGTLAPLLSLVYSYLRDSPFFKAENPSPLYAETSSNVDSTYEVRDTCLEFLRLAAILKSHLMDERPPAISDPLAECGALEQYLDVYNTCSVVNPEVMDRMCGTLIADNIFCTIQSTSSPAGTPVETQVGELSGVIRIWSSQLAEFASIAPVIAGSLLTNRRFYRPSLLHFPPTYDDIFQFYHQRKCSGCNSLPINPGLCLICGAAVSMEPLCCSQSKTQMCVDHAKLCGGGTGVFLVILKAIIVVLLEDRICLWGCIHLDGYGEEDKDLKRGKTLYLKPERYQLLHDQFVNSNFINTPHKWVSEIPTISQ